MSDTCFVQGCERPAVKVIVVADGWCPIDSYSGECPGHPYCAACAKSFEKRGTVVSEIPS